MNIVLSKVNFNSNTNFGRALTTPERKEHDEVCKQAYEVLGKDKTILIVPGFAMPQKPENNTGVGHLASEEAHHALDLLKSYTGANVIEDLPTGHSFIHNGYYVVYSGSALSLGDTQINLKSLTTPEYGEIVKKDEFDQVVKSNTTESLQRNVAEIATKETFINFENVALEDSPQNQVLKTAFERFKQSSDPKIVELKEKFAQYKKENGDWLEPKGLYQVLKRKYNQPKPRLWTDETDKNLYHPDYNAKKRQARKKELLKNHSDEIEFYKFKQFLAETHLAEAKQKLNQKGIKYFVDQQIGFHAEEIWAYPKAFMEKADLGWGLRALDFDTIHNKNSASAKLLARKTELNARRADGIRFDVGWSYISQRTIPHGSNKPNPPKYMDDTIINLLEKAVKKVKGEDFDTRNLIYEVEADWSDFPYKKNNVLIPPVQKIVKIYSSAHMNDDREGWGSNEAYLNQGFGEDHFVIGPGNHDPVSIRRIAETDSSDLGQLGHLKEMRNIFNQKEKSEEDIQQLSELRKKHDLIDENKFKAAMETLDLKERKEVQSKTLAKILGIDAETLRTNPIEFIKAKFAEPVAAKNNMIFFMDVLGRKERYNDQGITATNFRPRLTDSFESEYHTALQEGRGFNLMDSLEKVFKAKKLDEKHPELYKSIVKFRDKLSEKGVTTEKEANEKYGINDIISGSSEPKAKSFFKSKNFKFLAVGTAILATGIGLWAYNKDSEKEALSK